MFNCALSFRASSKVLRAFLLAGTSLVSWVPHFTTSIDWALRLGLHCLQQAQRPLEEPWVCVADFTMQIGCKKALIVLRVPVSALRMGRALTLQQVEVIGLSLGETWNGRGVNTVFLALFKRCGWPSHVLRHCGSDIKKGMVETLLEAPKRASWISDVSHMVANALKRYYAKLSLFQQFQSLCTRMRHRLQQTRFAFLLPPQSPHQRPISQCESTGRVGPSQPSHTWRRKNERPLLRSPLWLRRCEASSPLSCFS